MIALNKSEIRNKSVRFWGLFGILLLGTLITVYFFVWSAHKESEDYMAQIQSSRSAINKQIILYPMVDSLLDMVEELEEGRVFDYNFQKANIRDQRSNIARLIGADSAGSFSGYTKILQHLESQVALKDTLIGIKIQIRDIWNQTKECEARNTSLGQSLVRAAR